MHANNLAEILEMEMRPETREEHLNTVKMTVYLLCQFIDMIESDASKPSAIVSGKVREMKRNVLKNVIEPQKLKMCLCLCCTFHINILFL